MAGASGCFYTKIRHRRLDKLDLMLVRYLCARLRVRAQVVVFILHVICHVAYSHIACRSSVDHSIRAIEFKFKNVHISYFVCFIILIVYRNASFRSFSTLSTNICSSILCMYRCFHHSCLEFGGARTSTMSSWSHISFMLSLNVRARVARCQ